jgi:hypothetical protein
LSNIYRLAGEKLIEFADADHWPVAVIYYKPATRSFDVALATTAAELVAGHGRKIGLKVDNASYRIMKARGN